MTTSNLGLDNSLTSLTEGQEQKEAAINSNTTKLLANMDVLDTNVPIFMGEFPSDPASGTVALGSVYYNTTDSTLYTLRAKSPDTWYASSGSGGASWGGITGTLSDQTDLQSALDGKADSSHTHVKADITDFSDGDYATSVHTHVKADITDFNDADYATSVHTHVKADITDFNDADYATAAQGALADSALQDITGESIQDLSDVAAMTPTEGQVLTYQSGSWNAADATGGPGGPGGPGGSAFVEKPFRPNIVGRFGKNNTSPFPSYSARGIWNTTSHAPANDTIVNVYCPSLGSTSNTLTFFRVDGNQFEVISSETTTLISGSAVWVDISADGDRVAVAMRNSGADTIVILVTTNDWASYSVEQTLTMSDSNEILTSVALNSDGSRLWFATGSGGSGSVSPRVGYYDRVSSTWSFTANAYSTSSNVNLLLMFGQQDDNTVGFQTHSAGAEYTASMHVYQDSGGWSQVWTKASTNIGDSNTEADILSCISADGDTVFYRTGGSTAAIDVNVLTSPSTVGTFEGLAGSDAPFGMTADGKNIWYNSDNSNDGRIWIHYLDGTSMDEIGFASFNYEVVRPYGMQQHYMRPSKTGHYMMIGTTSGIYIDDAIFAGVPSGDYVSPSSGIKY